MFVSYRTDCAFGEKIILKHIRFSWKPVKYSLFWLLAADLEHSERIKNSVILCISYKKKNSRHNLSVFSNTIVNATACWKLNTLQLCLKKKKKGINASLIKVVWKPTEQRGEKALLGDC